MALDGNIVPFESVDHTADLAFIARGRTLPELFQNAARGMLDLLHDCPASGEEAETRIEVEAGDLEELLVAWLQEILYRREQRRQVVCTFEVESLRPPSADAPARLVAVVRGETWDPARHRLGTEVKAATYHGLEITREFAGEGEVYRVQVVLDV